MNYVSNAWFFSFRPGMKTGSSVILIALALADSLVLLVDLMEHLLYNAFGILIETMHEFICKSYRYSNMVINYVAVYQLVILTIFRVISVYLPHKSNVYCTRKRAFIAVSVTFVIICVINFDYLSIQYYPLFDANFNYIGNDCWFTGKWAHYHQYHVDYVTLCLKSLIPFCILITGNTVIIYKTRKFNAKRQEMTQTTNQSPDDSQSMTAMLISISVLFLVTQTPYIITNLIERRMNYDYVTPEYVAGFYLLETATRLLKLINNIANFFCYFISGKRFKSELVALMKGRARMKDSPAERNSGVSTTTTTF